MAETRDLLNAWLAKHFSLRLHLTALTILMPWYAQHICPSTLCVRDANHCATRR